MTIRFCSLIPALSDERGHAWNYNRAVEESLQRYPEIEFSAYVSKDCKVADLPAGWKVHFGRRKNGLMATLGAFFDYGKLFKETHTRQRIFFLESFKGAELMGLALAARLLMPKRDRLLLFLRWGPKKGRLREALFLWALRVSRAILLTDSLPIASFYKKSRALEINELPILMIKPPIWIPEAKREPCLRLYWPGHPRPPKGLAEIERLMGMKGVPHIQIELSLAEDGPKGPSRSDFAIRRLPLTLSTERYFEELARADMVLLPYDPKTYRYSISGIFVEAVVLGKLPIACAGSWLAHELASHDLSELIVDFSSPHLLHTLFELAQDRVVHSKLQAMQACYLKSHSSARFAASLTSLFLK